MENADNPGQSAAKNNSPVGIILLVLALILFAGVGGFFFLSQKNAPEKVATTTEKSASPTIDSSFSSIQEALSKSLSLTCVYEDGKMTTNAYIKAGAVRSDTISGDLKKTTSMIMKDKKIYMWSGNQGTMMEFDVEKMMPSVTAVPAKVTPATQNPQDAFAQLDKFRQNCKPATVADALFTPPSDVTFTDLSKAMKSIPSITGAMTKDQIEQLQKQYQQ
ncbi:MAG: hypothetical protein HZC02_02485 [Candidatus Levybacteria bacterium]|nr:hypothetical protein [Candidatus Levybacteria bacterium]